MKTIEDYFGPEVKDGLLKWEESLQVNILDRNSIKKNLDIEYDQFRSKGESLPKGAFEKLMVRSESIACKYMIQILTRKLYIFATNEVARKNFYDSLPKYI